MWAWAPGVDPMELPPVAGFRVGPSINAWDGLLIQIHYNNPGTLSGIIDNSGIRVYYTTTLRQFDADILELGDAGVTQPAVIPQGTGDVLFEYSCPSECSSTFGQTLNVFGDLLHMHQVGDMMWSTIWRNGVNLGYFNRIEFWDFNFQQTTPLSLTIQPGDRINTHCKYTQSPNTPVHFALASSDEMCLEYVYYYPKLPGPYCTFIYSEDVGRNATVCLNDFLQVNGALQYNPSVTDPPGGEIKVFGSINPSSFVCAASGGTPLVTNPLVSSSTSRPIIVQASAIQLTLSSLPLFIITFCAVLY